MAKTSGRITGRTSARGSGPGRRSTQAVAVGKARTGTASGKGIAGYGGRIATGARGGMADQALNASAKALGRSAPGTGGVSSSAGGAAGGGGSGITETTTGAGGTVISTTGGTIRPIVGRTGTTPTTTPTTTRPTTRTTTAVKTTTTSTTTAAAKAAKAKAAAAVAAKAKAAARAKLAAAQAKAKASGGARRPPPKKTASKPTGRATGTKRIAV